jgi:Ca-activated chloride channel homolog
MNEVSMNTQLTSFPKPVPAFLVLALVAMLTFVGCGRNEKPIQPASSTQSTKPPTPAASNVFTILATSDLRDIEPLIPQIESATGVSLRVKFGGTFESTEQVQSGTAGTDAAWFANAKYLLSDPAGQSKVKLQEKIMLSPLVIGVSESAAKQLGWAGGAKVTWADVMKAAKGGKLRYAMSNPASSNQGFMSLMGVAAASSGKSEALTVADVDRNALKDFLAGYKLVGDNSTYLSQKFKERQGNAPSEINAFINYESWLLSLNAKGELKEKLTLIYPHEGVATADYPFMLLNDARRSDYQKIVDYLKSEPAQRWLAQQTLRRPINPDVAVADLFATKQLLIELPFTTDRAVADSLIEAYLNEYRTPIASTFVLDVSGSMNKEGRLAALQKSLNAIAGEDKSITGRFSRLNSRERLWMLPFSSRVEQVTAFEIPAAAQRSEKEAKLTEIRQYADGLKAEGGTALYDAIFAALGSMQRQQETAQGYAYSVVVFTDGQRTEGMTLSAFEQVYAGLSAEGKKIPVFLVLYAEGEEKALKRIAQMTGGKVFDARKQSLESVFKEIRSYQ